MTLKHIFKKNRQTAVKGRSSALIITLAIHAILLFLAGAIVAVTVAQRSETKFEGKQIIHPKMKLKKLQVPVKIEQQAKRQTPTLRQRVTVNTRISTKLADFKMPDLAGVGSNSGVNLSGASFEGSLGFASTQINVFGLKRSGEKLLFLLDSGGRMLVDEIGGIPAYAIIKNELISTIDRLPPTTLFNVAVFIGRKVYAFSPELAPASKANVKKLKDWITPLNADLKKTGFVTLPTPGTALEFEPMAPIYNEQGGWIAGLSYALQKRVDSLYWLGISDGLYSMQKELWDDCNRGQPLKYPSGWMPDAAVRLEDKNFDYKEWEALRMAAYAKLNKENAERLARNQPVRVIGGGELNVIRAYFPSAKLPRNSVSRPAAHFYTGRDVSEYIDAMSRKYSAQDRRQLSIGLKTKPLSVNVLHFVPGTQNAPTLQCLKDVACENGGYKQISGLKAIQSAATAAPPEN